MINPSDISSILGLTFIDAIEQRRGSVLFKARLESEVYAVKGYDLEESDTYDRKQLLEREAAITREVSPHLQQALFVNYVRDETANNWLITHWIDGTPLAAHTLKSADGSTGRTLKAFIETAEAFDRVHKAGFLHGDVQPSHVIIPNNANSPVILDWGLARRIDEIAPYSGGFVHFTAPEIATGMLDKSDKITYTLSAEIYSFGALMAFCYTGQTATDYALSAPLEDKLKLVASGTLRPLPAPAGKLDEAITSVIAKCLAFNPENRPSSLGEVVRELQSAF